MATHAEALDCIYLSGAVSPSVLVLSASDYSEVLAIDAKVRSFGFVVRGRYAYVNVQGGPDDEGGHLAQPGRIVEVDLARGVVSDEFPAGRLNIDLAEAGSHLFTANAEDDSVTVVDLGTREAKTLNQVGNFPSTVTARPDGSRVFIGDQTGEVFVIDPDRELVDLSFETRRAITGLLATNDQLFFAGSASVFNDFGAYRASGDFYSEEWHTKLGFAFDYLVSGDEVFAARRRPSRELLR